MRNYRLIRISSLNLTVRAFNTAKKNNIKTVGKFIDLIEDVDPKLVQDVKDKEMLEKLSKHFNTHMGERAKNDGIYKV